MANLGQSFQLFWRGEKRNPKRIQRIQGLEFQWKPDVLFVIVF